MLRDNRLVDRKRRLHNATEAIVLRTVPALQVNVFVAGSRPGTYRDMRILLARLPDTAHTLICRLLHIRKLTHIRIVYCWFRLPATVGQL